MNIYVGNLSYGDEANEAINRLNGTTLDDREIVFNEARAKKNNDRF